MRLLTYFVACSADGFIAREDGGLGDFAFEGEHIADLLDSYPETIPTQMRGELDLSTTNREFETVLMGRRTYEVAFSVEIINPYAHLEQFVLSQSLTETPDANVQLVSSKAIDRLSHAAVNQH